jgi:hypothetical protein
MAFRWLPVLVWAGVIFAFSSIPSLNSGLGSWDYVLRKGAHMTEYAILAVLLVRATGSYTWGSFWPSSTPGATSSTRPLCADATVPRSTSGSTPSAR